MISVISPSVRPGGLDIVLKCLERQTYKDWEWIVSTPYNTPRRAVQAGVTPKGDYFYSLNRDWNRCFRLAKGDLIVSIVDLLWFPPDVLEKLWFHYQTDPMKCIGALGNQYDELVNGKPEHLVWSDPRYKEQMFSQTEPLHFELCIASIPRKAIVDVGGMDEKWDEYAALSEKELCYRIEKLGYTFWFDQSIEYRAIKHERLNGKEAWDEAYKNGVEYFNQCAREINAGTRKKLDFLS